VYTAATVPVETEGAKNPLLESALQIGEETTSDDESDAPVKKPSVSEPQEGSYERFMMTFGNPGRWAGH
jgi:hypothetical protein